MLKEIEITDEKKHDAIIDQWNNYRFNKLVLAMKSNQESDYVIAANHLDDISLREFLIDIDFAYSSDPCSSELKESIRATMLKSLESIDMNRQSFTDFYDDVQMKAAIQNIKIANRSDDDSERDWKLDQANKNLHVMFGQQAKNKASVMQKRVQAFKRGASISLFKEARQKFPNL